MSAFRSSLSERATDAQSRRWLFVPYDQLSSGMGPLAREEPDELGIVLVECPQKAERRPYQSRSWRWCWPTCATSPSNRRVEPNVPAKKRTAQDRRHDRETFEHVSERLPGQAGCAGVASGERLNGRMSAIVAVPTRKTPRKR